VGSITVGNLDDDVKTRLRTRAARNGRSMAEEVRLILREAIDREQTKESNGRRLEAWIRLYGDEMTYARQHESLRTNSASLIVAATGGVLALLASEAMSLEEQPLLGIVAAGLVAVINVIGWFIGEKHYERTRRHQAIASAYRKVISDNCQLGAVLTDERCRADRCHKKEFECWERRSLHKLWGTIHVVFFLLGLVMVCICMVFYFWCSR